MMIRARLFFFFFCIVLVCTTTQLYAQQAGANAATNPATTGTTTPDNDESTSVNIPMHNIFYNTLWGSVTGGLFMIGANAVDGAKADEMGNLAQVVVVFFRGATYGALFGVLIGFYLSMNGITFTVSNQPTQQNLYLANLDPSQLHTPTSFHFHSLRRNSVTLWHYHTTF